VQFRVSDRRMQNETGLSGLPEGGCEAGGFEP